jgi:hypothetical protein
MPRKPTRVAKKASGKERVGSATGAQATQLYTLEVVLISGPITEKFYRKNPVVSRTIQMRGDQTLEDLHFAIFDSFEREEEHLYEFQFGKGPRDRKALVYAMPHVFDQFDEQMAGIVDETTLDSLNLEAGRSFAYWFDFGDDWWHEIKVASIDEKVPRGKFPKVTNRVGKSPPQYADYDEDE